jgi:hypothetical protein
VTSFVGPQRIALREYRPGFKGKDLSVHTLPILAVDPGGTTGWSLLSVRRKAFEAGNLGHILSTKHVWYHGQVDCVTNEHLGIYQICKMMDDWPSAAIVLESFYVRQMAVDLSPVRIIGACTQHAWVQGRKVIEQQASMAKRLNNSRLKDLGVYTSDGGLDHARDADRHALMCLRRAIMDEKMRRKAWPHIYK